MTKVILIVGASSGIGRALAVEYALRHSRRLNRSQNDSDETPAPVSPAVSMAAEDTEALTMAAAVAKRRSRATTRESDMTELSSSGSLRDQATTAGETSRYHARAPTLVLALTARRLSELEVVKSEIESMSEGIVRVEIATMDVRDGDAVFDIMDDLVARIGRPFDVVVVNAGVSGGHGHIGSEATFKLHADVVMTNTIGAFAVINAAIAQWNASMCGGHIVGISSVASVRGFPTWAGYSASKIALDYYLESLRAELAERNPAIVVTTLHPGFINTPINQDLERRPFLITVNKAASLICDHIEAQRQDATIPWWPWAIAGPILRWLPRSLVNAAVSWQPPW